MRVHSRPGQDDTDATKGASDQRLQKGQEHVACPVHTLQLVLASDSWLPSVPAGGTGGQPSFSSWLPYFTLFCSPGTLQGVLTPRIAVSGWLVCWGRHVWPPWVSDMGR